MAEYICKFEVEYGFLKAESMEIGDELIRCKDCKHRPTVNGEYEDGFDIEFPNFSKCPCECEDGWYNWMPKDDWYCANAERKEE